MGCYRTDYGASAFWREPWAQHPSSIQQHAAASQWQQYRNLIAEPIDLGEAKIAEPILLEDKTK